MTDKNSIAQLALDHAWKWFEYHASQRMTMLRFYLIAAGGIAAGVGALLAATENVLAGIVSIIGVITSLCFKRLDQRVSDLVKIGENALKVEQSKMSVELGSEAWLICEQAGKRPHRDRFYTYGQNFRFLFRVLAGCYAVTAVMGFGRALWPYLQTICLSHLR